MRVRDLATEAILRTRGVLLLSAVMLISACAHAPSRPSPPPAPVAADAVPPAEPSSTYPQSPTPPAEQAPEPGDVTLGQQPTQVAGLTPAQYSDLFDRMRAGF